MWGSRGKEDKPASGGNRVAHPEWAGLPGETWERGGRGEEDVVRRRREGCKGEGCRWESGYGGVGERKASRQAGEAKAPIKLHFQGHCTDDASGGSSVCSTIVRGVEATSGVLK